MTIINPRDIQIEEYNYALPDERIAKYPLDKRDESKLLLYQGGKISHDVFKHVTRYLPSGSLLVYNNTRVIQARLHFQKPTGAFIEVFLLEPYQPHDYEQIFQTRNHCSWLCMIGNLKKWRGTHEPLSKTVHVLRQNITLQVELGEEQHAGHEVSFTWDGTDVSFADILEAMGELPIPPYLNRHSEERDKETYQTVYSKIKGSVAAPTAGLHFTDDVLADVDAHGITREEVTLHVGAGTFKPVKSTHMADHEMHREYISVSRRTIQALLQHADDVTAVGTTSTRTLESLYYIGCKLMDNPSLAEEELTVGQWEPYDEPRTVNATQALQALLAWMNRNQLSTLNTSTSLIIAPGYKYNVVRRLITNFHQPKSTLLLLVSAFIGNDWKNVYRYALDNDFRFLSYGDSSLLIP